MPEPSADDIGGGEILEAASRAFSEAGSEHALDQAKAEFLNKNGKLKPLLDALQKLPPDQRPDAGRRLNALRGEMEALWEKGRRRLQEESVNRQLAKSDDVSLPGRTAEAGGIHPVSLAMERASETLACLGFEVADGPEIESDHYNFTALNHPPDHPARSMHDTFYTADGRLLRTHTSPVQIRHMLERSEPPVRAIAPGRVYRCDHDATHSPMFHQIEGIWIDRAVNFANLKGVLGDFFRSFFDDDGIQVRFRPSFFPFTEPSAECDILRDGKWMEVAGCGMIHPRVLMHGGMDGEGVRGFAFGMGVERMAMLLYGIADIRLLFENDMRFLSQFADA